MFAPARLATVLIVEDDPQLRDLYRHALHSATYRALVVGDGMAALTVIERELPDVLVLDLGLPRVSGWDVYRELRSRKETKSLPIIIVSGNNLRDIHPQDLASHFTKPIDPETLVAAVDAALGPHR